MSVRRSVLWLSPLWAAACTQPAPQAAAPTVDSTAVRNAVSNFLASWVTADTSGNVAALTALLADSVRIDVRGAPVLMGRAAAQAFMEPMYKANRYTSVEFMPDMTIPVSNDLAYQNGSYREGVTSTNPKMAKPMMDYGRYAMAVRKDADGQWRMTYIMVFSDSTVAVKK